jgi:Bacterial protein of unknown function (DUF922)
MNPIVQWLADNCDIFINPADCQNTGWTIGVIATAGGATAAAAAAAAKGKPKVTETKHQVKDCNEAVNWIKSSKETGSASSDVKPVVGKQVSGKSGDKYTASADVKWKFNPDSSTTDLQIPEWPDMSDADKAAVKKYRDALKAHEDGHHQTAKDWAASEKAKITGEGATPEEAQADLQQKLNDYQAAAQQKLDAANQQYEDTTHSGATQDAVGGQNVELTCP